MEITVTNTATSLWDLFTPAQMVQLNSVKNGDYSLALKSKTWNVAIYINPGSATTYPATTSDWLLSADETLSFSNPSLSVWNLISPSGDQTLSVLAL